MKPLFASQAGLLAFGLVYSFPSVAQIVPTPDTGSFLTPRSSSQVNPFDAPSREYTGLSVGSWMLYPTLFTGAAFDSNIYQNNGKTVSDVAWRTAPSLIAVRNAGIQKTLLYGTGDFMVYGAHSAVDQVNGKGGFTHIWEAQRDLIFRFTGDASRQVDASTSGSVLNGAYLRPVYYEQYQTTASVLKSFDRFFVGLGGSFQNSSYENTSNTAHQTVTQAYRDNNVVTASGRLGYFITPLLYSFVESTGNWANYYNSSSYNSEGYKVSGGLGTDRISLFKGEVYAGYQQQFYKSAAFGDVGAPAFGGKLFWYPTQYITVSANVDETLGTATFVSPSNPNGSATKTTGGGLKVDYTLSEVWSANARGGYSHATYVNNSRVDDTWSAGATLNYRIWRNFSATLDYQFSAVDSNYAAAGYVRHIASLGVTYKY
ncbi:hypothetical protein GGD83_004397 [Rhodoblastus sphagnicola]|uniref:outer membrane beta-barrel protein n=1 Tax=Rhodoblastus sphagnicola TaxID=333368 RepID=UPI00160AF4CE|nr:outer membrane beta-barrel protein [Rhodoblastus sphagnicola]MBB4200568.1 hypothetical protein [Rhodoblastus sphagnicola]